MVVLVAACLCGGRCIEFHVPRRPRAIVERVVANMATLVDCVCVESVENRSVEEWRLQVVAVVTIGSGGERERTLQFNDAHVPKYRSRA